MEIRLMLMKDMRTMLIAETEEGCHDGIMGETYLCRNVMTLTWAHFEGTVRRVFNVFPALAGALLSNYKDQLLEIGAENIFCVYSEGGLSGALLRDYATMKRNLYGK